MKVTLNLDKLLAAGKINREEYEKLAELSRQSVKSHAYSVLIVLACISLVAGFIGMNPQFFAGLFKDFAALFGRDGVHLVLVLGLIAWGVITRSGFQIGLSCIVILNWLGGSTFYEQGGYFLAIRQPAPTVVVFSLLAAAGLAVSRTLRWDLERLALIFARTCLFIVNMGFWVGSIWGSPFAGEKVPAWGFSALWAIALLSVGAWGALEGRLFVLNLSVVFGSIHFYTQWFETLGANPGSLVFAGAVALLVTYKLREFNQKVRAARSAPPPAPPAKSAEPAGPAA